MSPVGKLITRGAGLAVSVLVMAASGFMVALLEGPGIYSGNAHEQNVAGLVFCVSTLSAMGFFIGVVLSIIALGRQQDASRTPGLPR